MLGLILAVGVAKMTDWLANDELQLRFPQRHFRAATGVIGGEQIHMLAGVRANLLPPRHPLKKLGFVHQRRLRDPHSFIPQIGFTDQPTNRVAGGRKSVFVQRRQGMDEVVLIAIIKGNADNFAAFFALQMGQQTAHGQTLVA